MKKDSPGQEKRAGGSRDSLRARIFGTLAGDASGGTENRRLPGVPSSIADLLERMDAEAERMSREVSLRQLATLARGSDDTG